jgi:hypothetical protein
MSVTHALLGRVTVAVSFAGGLVVVAPHAAGINANEPFSYAPFVIDAQSAVRNWVASSPTAILPAVSTPFWS